MEEAVEVMKTFKKNISSYGGIRKLFEECEKTSPEYADAVEKKYIRAIETLFTDS